MTTQRLVFMFIAWLLAAGAIAIAVAVVVTEMLVLIGIVDRSGPDYGFSLNVLTAVVWLGLAAVPFVFRSRFVSDADADDPAPQL